MQSVAIHRVEMPLKQPFGHAQAVRTRSENVVLRISHGEDVGIGECAPRSYVTGETMNGVIEAVRGMDLTVLDELFASGSFEDCVRALERAALPARLGKEGARAPAAATLLELAVLDLAGRRFGRPLAFLADALELPHAVRRRPDEPAPPSVIAFDLARKPEDFLERVRSRPPPHIAKVKVDGSVVEERVRIARDAVGDAGTVAVDANMAWSGDFAVEKAKSLRPLAIAWYEEPLARGDLEGYRTFRRRSGVAVMLDESVSGVDDGLAAIRAEAVDLFNIRVSKAGGLVPALRLAALAAEHGVRYQSGVQVAEFGILGAAARAFREMVANIVAVEGSGASYLLPEDVVIESSAPSHGLGLDLRPEIVERYATGTWTWTRREGWRTLCDR